MLVPYSLSGVGSMPTQEEADYFAQVFALNQIPSATSYRVQAITDAAYKDDIHDYQVETATLGGVSMQQMMLWGGVAVGALLLIRMAK